MAFSEHLFIPKSLLAKVFHFSVYIMMESRGSTVFDYSQMFNVEPPRFSRPQQRRLFAH